MAMTRLHAGGAPVRQIVLGEGPGLLDVPHLGRRAAAAPLLVHQTELDARLLQHLSGGPGVRRAVERGLAVDEHDRLAADGDVQPVGPVPDVLLAAGLAVPGAKHGLVLELVGQPVPQLPAVPVQSLVDHQRPRGPDDLHRLGTGLVEVTDEQGVRAPDLTRPALGAVDVVVGHVGDVEQPLVHRDDVGVEGGGRVVLVPRDLHDRADLAAELVSGGEAVVAVLPPRSRRTRAGVARSLPLWTLRRLRLGSSLRSPLSAAGAGRTTLSTMDVFCTIRSAPADRQRIDGGAAHRSDDQEREERRKRTAARRYGRAAIEVV